MGRNRPKSERFIIGLLLGPVGLAATSPNPIFQLVFAVDDGLIAKEKSGPVSCSRHGASLVAEDRYSLRCERACVAEDSPLSWSSCRRDLRCHPFVGRKTTCFSVKFSLLFRHTTKRFRSTGHSSRSQRAGNAAASCPVFEQFADHVVGEESIMLIAKEKHQLYC